MYCKSITRYAVDVREIIIYRVNALCRDKTKKKKNIFYTNVLHSFYLPRSQHVKENARRRQVTVPFPLLSSRNGVDLFGTHTDVKLYDKNVYNIVLYMVFTHSL